MVRFAGFSVAPFLLSTPLIFGSDDDVLMQSHNGQEAFHRQLHQDALELTKPLNKTNKNEKTHAHLQTMHQNLMQGVKDRMATGGKAPVSTDVADALDAQFTLLEEGLTTEVASQRTRANALNDPIQACNTAKTTAFTRDGGVDFLQTTVNSARTTHSTCRDGEVTDCDAYRQEATTLRSSAPTCSCGGHWGQNGNQITTTSVADGVEDCMALHETWMTSYNSLVNKQTACNNRVNTCSTDQSAFESDFCQYREGLTSACQGLTACLEPQGQATLVAQRETSRSDLQMLEASQKELYVVVQKCKCWVDLLKVDSVPTTEQFSSCATLDPSTSDLDLSYPDFLPVETCSTQPVTRFPGDGQWRVTEYDSRAWVGLLQAVTPCIVPTRTIHVSALTSTVAESASPNAPVLVSFLVGGSYTSNEPFSTAGRGQSAAASFQVQGIPTRIKFRGNNNGWAFSQIQVEGHTVAQQGNSDRCPGFGVDTEPTGSFANCGDELAFDLNAAWFGQ